MVVHKLSSATFTLRLNKNMNILHLNDIISKNMLVVKRQKSFERGEEKRLVHK